MKQVHLKTLFLLCIKLRRKSYHYNSTYAILKTYIRKQENNSTAQSFQKRQVDIGGQEVNEDHRSGTGQEFRLDESRLMAQINHTGTMILSITAVTVCICGQMEMMISVTMDCSTFLGHALVGWLNYICEKKRQISL